MFFKNVKSLLARFVLMLALLAGLAGVVPARSVHAATPSSPPAVFTLVLQPDAAAGVDTYIYSGSKSSNFGVAPDMGIGEDSSANNKIARILLRFDLSSVPENATINSATLSLWTSADLSSNNRAIQVYRLKVPFNETQSTWNLSAAGVGWQSAGASGANDRESTAIGSTTILNNEPLNLEKQIVLTPGSIQEMVNGSFVNRGFVVVASTEQNDRFNYTTSDSGTSSQRPQIVIQYTMPSVVPSHTPILAGTPVEMSTSTQTPSPTATLPSPSITQVTNTALPTKTPKRRWTLTATVFTPATMATETFAPATQSADTHTPSSAHTDLPTLTRTALPAPTETLQPTSTPTVTATIIPSTQAADTVTPTQSMGPTVTPSYDSLLVNINHESGDFSQYTAYQVDGGDLTVSPQAGLAGTVYGLSVVVDDSNRAFAYKSLETAGTTGVIRARFYIDPNSLSMSDLSQVSFIFLINSGAADTFASMKLMRINGSYYLRGVMVDDNGVHQETSAWPIADEPHYAEIRVSRASSATAEDATYETWIDGDSKTTMTGVDSYEKFFDCKFVSAGLNGIAGTVSGTYYVDEIVVNEDGSTIGPVHGVSPSYTHTPSMTPTDAATQTSMSTYTIVGDGLTKDILKDEAFLNEHGLQKPQSEIRLTRDGFLV